MDSKAPTPYSARKSYFLGLEYLLHEPKNRFSQIHKQFESREVLCDYICAAPYGYHKCFSDEDFERFAGCDLTKCNDI